LAPEIVNRPKRAVERALEALCPSPSETEFLRACLWRGEPAAGCWRNWRALVEDPVSALSTERGGLKYLLPLALEAASGGEEEERELTALMRAAHLRERLRDELCAKAYTEIEAALAARGLSFLVGGEFAVATSAYPERGLRHCHELELLLEPADFDEAGRALGADLDCVRLTSTDERGALFEHPSGLPVRLSPGTLGWLEDWTGTSELEPSAVSVVVGRSPARLPSDADLLVDVVLRTVAARRPPALVWACDGVLLSRSAGLEPERLLERGAGTALVLSVLARYLANELGAPIPEQLLESLRRSGAGSSAGERAAILERFAAWYPRALFDRLPRRPVSAFRRALSPRPRKRRTRRHRARPDS
jgi:hypothetical protein